MSRVSTSEVFGTLLAVVSWILVVSIVLIFLHDLVACGWLCLD